MIFTDWLERRRLVRKGLACDKTRLSQAENTFQERAEGSWQVRLALLGFFAGTLALGTFWHHAGPVLETLAPVTEVFFGSLVLLHLLCPEIAFSNSRLLLLFGAVWLNVAVLKEICLIWPQQEAAAMAQAVFLSPRTFAPFLVTLLLGTRAGLFAVIQVTLLAAVMVYWNFGYTLASLLAGLTAVYFGRNIRKRADLLRAGLAVGLVALVCGLVDGFMERQTWQQLGWLALYGLASGMVTALVVSAILPLVEWLFQITTTISWLELADLNHPLLQQMTMEAPGTYHHSLMVANIAEAGAKAIGLDATACRVMAYFHDIGKIIKPEYFIENIPPGANPHENLSPSMSALIIIAHVKEGVDLAIKYRLKRQILEAIQQHHGDSVVTYFHQRALQQQADAREGGKIMNMREEDVPDVSEDSFRYPGPRPQNKEIALLSLADAIEAASRSLERPTPQRIDDLVREIVAGKIESHQLDESHLTLNEIRAASDAMAATVKNMMHTRIAYARKDKSSASTLVQPAKRGLTPDASASAAA